MTLSIRNTSVLETITLPNKKGGPSKKRLYNIVKRSIKIIPERTSSDTDENKPYVKVEMLISPRGTLRDEVVDWCLEEVEALLQLIDYNGLTYSYRTEKRKNNTRGGEKTERFLLLMLHR